MSSRITQLDGLRACAIAAVFIHHAFHIPLLWMGVDLFFVLSGFLITGILVNQKKKSFGTYIGHFYSRRTRRILPPYLLLLILVALIYPGPWLRLWYMYLGAMNFIFAFGFPSVDVLTPLWSLAVEEQFYLIWPLAVYFLNRKQLVYCAVGLIAFAPALRFICTPLFDNHFAIYMLLPFRMDTLAVGALIALSWGDLKVRLAQNPRLNKKLATVCGFTGVTSLVVLGMLQFIGYTTHGNTRLANVLVYECTLGLMASLFMVVLAGYGRSVLNTAPFQMLGRISYSFYLIHLLVLQKVPQLHGLVALAVSLTFSIASWWFIEKPILGSGKPDQVLVSAG